jgi:hypothetical protein
MNSDKETTKVKKKTVDFPAAPTIDGILVENDDTDLETVVQPRTVEKKTTPAVHQTSYLLYIFLPFIFLTVTLLGGLRLASPDSAFIFLKPPLFCLIFAVILVTPRRTDTSRRLVFRRFPAVKKHRECRRTADPLCGVGPAFQLTAARAGTSLLGRRFLFLLDPLEQPFRRVRHQKAFTLPGRTVRPGIRREISHPREFNRPGIGKLAARLDRKPG